MSRPLFAFLLMAVAGCNPNQEVYKDFLGRDATGTQVGSNDKAQLAAAQINSASVAIAKGDEAVEIKASEWEALEGELRRCKAEASSHTGELETRLRAEFAKGELSCRERAVKELEDASRTLVEDAKQLISDLRDRLARYSFASAVVNGRCRARMLDGKLYVFTMRNVCANVVSKTVGSNGEIDGIAKAVSASAQKEGIVDFECSIGSSNIVFLEKPCDETQGTAAGAAAATLGRDRGGVAAHAAPGGAADTETFDSTSSRTPAGGKAEMRKVSARDADTVSTDPRGAKADAGSRTKSPSAPAQVGGGAEKTGPSAPVTTEPSPAPSSSTPAPSTLPEQTAQPGAAKTPEAPATKAALPTKLPSTTKMQQKAKNK